MKKSETKSYSNKIRNRIRAGWAVFILMLVYMVAVSELGGGDSRIMTGLAERVSRLLFFGGMIYVIYRIVHNKKLLTDREQMAAQMREERDERNQYLHDKSGGTVLDILLLLLYFVTVTAALFNMPAFYTALAVFTAAVLLKAGAYLLYSRIGG